MSVSIDRRRMLALGAVAAGAAAPALAEQTAPSKAAATKLSLEIGPVSVELAPGVVIQTTGYNGTAPGPVLRLREGQPVEIAVRNRMAAPNLVHWHGLHNPPVQDGAVEEGSLAIAPGGELTYRFTPRPAGTHWYHTHVMAMTDLTRGGYNGEFGFLLVEPTRDPARYDREVLLAAHHWNPKLSAPDHHHGHCAMLSYEHASLNGHKLGAGEPIRVKRGERVLFRILNASASEDIMLALPGHRFTVIALDGSPVPNPQAVDVLALSVAERIDAVVEMNQPGVWVLGSVRDAERAMGLGVVIEYENARGPAVWRAPPRLDFAYASFAGAGCEPSAPDGVFTMLFERRVGDDGIERWLINGRGAEHGHLPSLKVRRGGRYRFRWINASGCAHPVHLHRHRFQLTRVNQTMVSGLMKDTVNLPAYGVVEAEFVADNPGATLFHCHHQLHMDFGFMLRLDYV
jgi:FtsP/CotA-like multicopper oxidase with cupredoxin domain